MQSVIASVQTLHCIALHCIGLIPILGRGQTSGAHSGKQSSGWSNGFPLADAAKVDRDGSTRQLDVLQCNIKDMIIIIIIVGEGDSNTRECVTAIEDQYNFCIKRADLRQKCAPEKTLELHKWSGGWGRPSWNVLRLQHTGHHKCRIGQDFTFPRPRGGWFKLGWAAGRKRVRGGTIELGEAPKTVSEEGN